MIKKIINSYQYFVIYDFVSYELQKKLKNYNMMIYYSIVIILYCNGRMGLFMFIGREKEIKSLMYLLENPKCGCAVIYGPRRLKDRAC